MQHDFNITYKNIVLRPLESSDIEYLRRWRNNPQNNRYLRKIPFITEDMQKQWFRSYLENSDEICFAIEEIEELHRIVGSLSLYCLKHDYCFLGKILVGDEFAHGKNVGTNASIAASYIAFDKLGFNEVRLHVYPKNIAGLKVYQRAGFSVLDLHIDEQGLEEYTMIKNRKGE